jgi:hypothetical protein
VAAPDVGRLDAADVPRDAAADAEDRDRLLPRLRRVRRPHVRAR